MQAYFVTMVMDNMRFTGIEKSPVDMHVEHISGPVYQAHRNTRHEEPS